MFNYIVIILLVILLFMRRKRYPPGPNILIDRFCGTAINEEAKQNLFRHYLKLSNIYGPIFQVRLDDKPTVIITDPDLAIEALVGKADDFAGRPEKTMFNNSPQETNDLGTSPYNDRFRAIKKAAATALWRYMSGDHLEHRVLYVCERLSDVWRSHQGSPFNPCQMLAYPGVGVCLGAMFNTDYSPSDPDYEYVRENMEGFVKLDVTGQGATAELLHKIGEEYPEFMRKKIEVAERGMDDDRAQSIVEHLLVVMRESEAGTVKRYLRENMPYLLTDIMGGNITMHSTLIWMVFFLARYPAVQERLYAQIKDVIGDGELVRASHRRHMLYAEAVLCEIMRRGTITPIGFPHTTTKSTHLAGYHIPNNTDVTFHFYAFHHSRKYFNEPEVFKPERFIKNGEIHRPKALMPFGAGRRKCLAEMIAKPELFMIMCHLVRRWRIEFPAGSQYSEEYATSKYSVAGLPMPFEILTTERAHAKRAVKISKGSKYH